MPPVQCLITIYVNYALPSCCKTLYMWIIQYFLLQRHYICELCNAMLFSQSSCMWIISCYHFLYYVFHLSTTFVDSTTLPVHQPFEAVMEVSGVKKGIQSRQCYLLKQTSCWSLRAPQRRIQRLMTSPISPLRSMLKLGRFILPMSCMLSCIA